jgi:hypothetical protein
MADPIMLKKTLSEMVILYALLSVIPLFLRFENEQFLKDFLIYPSSPLTSIAKTCLDPKLENATESKEKEELPLIKTAPFVWLSSPLIWMDREIKLTSAEVEMVSPPIEVSPPKWLYFNLLFNLINLGFTKLLIWTRSKSWKFREADLIIT